MKKLLALSISILCAIFLIGPAGIAYAGELVVFEKTYIRETQKPQVSTNTFMVSRPTDAFTLILKNGRYGLDRVSSASLVINGKQILGPSDFNRGVDEIRTGVLLKNSNEIRVELASKPGAYITVKIVSEGSNTPPVANAGPDQSAAVNRTIQLNGSGSSDIDGDPLTFRWSFISRPPGSAASLSDPTIVNPAFRIDKAGNYVVQLVVNDGRASSAPDTVTISTQNSAPVADAGSDQTVWIKQVVTLDGSKSSDIDGDALTFRWEIIRRPVDSKTELSDPTAVQPTFGVDIPGIYEVQLVVNDGLLDSAPDTVAISTANSPPIAEAGPDQTVPVDTAVILDGSKSSDMDGDPLMFHWSLLSRPVGSVAMLSDGSAVKPTFVVDLPGQYVLQLYVHDGLVNSAADTVTVSTVNSAPVANAGPDQTAYVGDTVQLDGSGSTDVDGDALSFLWFLSSIPPGSAASLSNPVIVDPTFKVDFPGTYVANLTVYDGKAYGVADTVVITTENSKPVANAGPDQTVYVHQKVELDGSASSDADKDALSYIWSLLQRPAGSQAEIDAKDFTFTPDLPGLYIIQLRVWDGTVESDSDTMIVTAELPPVQVPDVRGMLRINAEGAITGAMLNVGAITTSYSPTIEAGRIISQAPLPQASVPVGTAVSLVVSLGPVMRNVPNVVGMSQASAEAAIAGAFLAVGSVAAENSSSVPAGSIISQDPSAGSSVPEGSGVFLVVSAGPVMVTVPNVVGLQQAQAESAILAAHLAVGTISEVNSDTVAAGKVISENPAGGTGVPEGSRVDLTISLGPAGPILPPDPSTVAPPLDPTVNTSLFAGTQFLFTGSDPIQTGVAPGTIKAHRAAILRGRVLSQDGNPLSFVTISILNHPEFGQTLSRADGMFDLAVNGGSLVNVNYGKSGYLPAQRLANVPWLDYVVLPDVVLLQPDSRVTSIDLTSNLPIQTARGNPVNDSDGSRQATLLFAQGTTATMVMPNGSTLPLTNFNVRATEYTVGSNGLAAMPAALPPTSGYTYAVELSIDEALSAGAADVRFDRPILVYVENFLNFPVGGIVPSGYYDRRKAAWIPSENGKVIKILGIDGGMATLDSIGNGLADNGVTLGVTDAERTQLAALYAPGQSLWRVPTSHFTPWDYNWPYGPPADARPPRVTPPQNDPPDVGCRISGSIIDCKNQTLGESVKVSGTPYTLNYQSGRVPGRRVSLTIPLRDTSASIPASLRRIELKIDVAGRSFVYKFSATAQSTQFTWDGMDAYGRAISGTVPITVTIGYVYGAVYYQPSQFVNAFSAPSGTGTSIVPGRSALEITISQAWTSTVTVMDARGNGLGGWTLNMHHSYDPSGRILHLGDGTSRSAASINEVISTVAGTGTRGFSGDGGAAIAADLGINYGIAVGPDGSIYTADYDNNRIRKVGTDGIITTVAGSGVRGFSGDGGLATDAAMRSPTGIAIAQDGSLYIADVGNNCIRRVGPDGKITTVVGTGSRGFSGDGGPATAAMLDGSFMIALGPDGSLYITDQTNQRIRKVGPDGIINTIAGSGAPGSGGFSGDGGPAASARLNWPFGIALGPDGSIFISDTSNYRIRKVGPNGIISTVAGTGTFGFSVDGGPATTAQLQNINGLAVGQDGSLYILDSARIRRVGPDGIITTVAGGVQGYSGDGGPATAAKLSPARCIAVSKDDGLYIADSSNYRIRKIEPALPGFAYSDLMIPSEDGAEIYVFNASGRHLRTLNALTNAMLYAFEYDSNGVLTRIIQEGGSVTTIERNAAGQPAAIIGPGLYQTALTLDGAGYLASITNPAGNVSSFLYSESGLLSRFTDPAGEIYQFNFDSNGRLLEDIDPAGGRKALARSLGNSFSSVAFSSALSRTTTYRTEQLPDGKIRDTVVQPNGLSAIMLSNTDGSRTLSFPTGEQVALAVSGDPRFSLTAPITSSLTYKTPGGLTSTRTQSRTVTLATPGDRMSLATQIDTLTINGRNYTKTFERSSGQVATQTPLGRRFQTTLNQFGRLTRLDIPEITPITMTYNSNGKLSTISQGTRSYELTYDAAGRITGIRDPLSRSSSFNYDSAGRLIEHVYANGRRSLYDYNARGDLTALTPPGKPAYNFLHNDVGDLQSYSAPQVGSESGTTSFQYNADRQTTQMQKPDGSSIAVSYDQAGRMSSMTLPTGMMSFAYNATTGLLTSMSYPTGGGISFSYDGSLLSGTNWTGSVFGSVSHTYNTDLQPATQRVNGGSAISFQYDADAMLTGVGALQIARNSANGLISNTTVGDVADALSYNEYGEIIGYAARYQGADVFSVNYVRDNLGRISRKTETTMGSSAVYDFNYDLAGRLSEVRKDGNPAAAYVFDENGNRLSRTTPGETVTGTYDDQDRKISYGPLRYSYAPSGELVEKSDTLTEKKTRYVYDALGNLSSATLPDGTVVEYVIDGLGRRIGKKVNSVLVQGLLYMDKIRPVAELDGSGNLVSRFVYGSKLNVPDYMERAGVTYRIISDHLGSPRLVVNTASGVVAQRLEYDEFGNVTMDTNPGFQPFGFAGGIYDRHLNLMRFGARDYDPETGTWTSRDPILFAGGQTNLYTYVNQNPINRIDPNGLYGAGFVLGVAAEAGDTEFLLESGAAASSQIGGGFFSNSLDPRNWTWMEFASQGWFYKGICGKSDQSGETPGSVEGLSIGPSVGLFLTNADYANQLRGVSTTNNLNFIFVTVSTSEDKNGIWQVSISLGGFGGGVSTYDSTGYAEEKNSPAW